MIGGEGPVEAWWLGAEIDAEIVAGAALWRRLAGARSASQGNREQAKKLRAMSG